MRQQFVDYVLFVEWKFFSNLSVLLQHAFQISAKTKASDMQKRFTNPRGSSKKYERAEEKGLESTTKAKLFYIFMFERSSAQCHLHNDFISIHISITQKY